MGGRDLRSLWISSQLDRSSGPSLAEQTDGWILSEINWISEEGSIEYMHYRLCICFTYKHFEVSCSLSQNVHSSWIQSSHWPAKWTHDFNWPALQTVWAWWFSDIWLSPFLLFLYTCFKNISLYWLDLNKRQSREEKAFLLLLFQNQVTIVNQVHRNATEIGCVFQRRFLPSGFTGLFVGLVATKVDTQGSSTAGLQEVLGTGGGSLLKCQPGCTLWHRHALQIFPLPRRRIYLRIYNKEAFKLRNLRLMRLIGYSHWSESRKAFRNTVVVMNWNNTDIDTEDSMNGKAS